MMIGLLKIRAEIGAAACSLRCVLLWLRSIALCSCAWMACGVGYAGAGSGACAGASCCVAGALPPLALLLAHMPRANNGAAACESLLAAGWLIEGAAAGAAGAASVLLPLRCALGKFSLRFSSAALLSACCRVASASLIANLASLKSAGSDFSSLDCHPSKSFSDSESAHFSPLGMGRLLSSSGHLVSLSLVCMHQPSSPSDDEAAGLKVRILLRHVGLVAPGIHSVMVTGWYCPDSKSIIRGFHLGGGSFAKTV